MKNIFKSHFLPGSLAILFTLLFVASSSAQVFQVILNFTDPNPAMPYSGVTVVGDTLYGTTYTDGSQNLGMVFKVKTNGADFQILKSFSGSDGSYPLGNLAVSDGVIYGTTQTGGQNGVGAIFRMNTDGSEYMVLKDFVFAANGDGKFPYAGLVLSGSTLYGTASQGGAYASGVIFQINTNGSGYTVLRNVSGSDGGIPKAPLFLLDGVFYGTMGQANGTTTFGTVFKMNMNGGGYTVLKTLGETDGKYPYSPVIVVSNTVYGTTPLGGAHGYGTVFKVNTDTTGFAVLKDFDGTNGSGAFGGLTAVGNKLYGMTQGGGTQNYGAIFQMNLDGGGFSIVRSLSATDGKYPQAGLTLDGNTLYGTTQQGGNGANGGGTVFMLALGSAPVTNTISSHAISQGQIQLDYIGSAGTNYVLDQVHGLASPIAWLPVATNAAGSDGSLHFTNMVGATNTYWRIRTAP